MFGHVSREGPAEYVGRVRGCSGMCQSLVGSKLESLGKLRGDSATVPYESFLVVLLIIALSCLISLCIFVSETVSYQL